LKYPVDYCVIVLGDIQPFVELHFESLLKTMDFGCFESLNIVDKETKDGSIQYIEETQPDANIYPLGFFRPRTYNNIGIGSAWQWDMAYSWQHAVENCGDSEWVLLIHPDVVFWNAKIYFEEMWKLVTESTAIVYDGNSLLIRREAYAQSFLKFWPLMGTCYQKTTKDYIQEGKILPVNKQNAGSLVIEGIEICELIYVELSYFGWEVTVVPDTVSLHKGHLCQCTKHDLDLNDPVHEKLWDKKMAVLQSHLERLRAGGSYM